MRFDVGELIGEFEVKSGKLRVTDPCYDDDTWCSGILSSVKNGTWRAYAYVENYGPGGFGGDRIKKLIVFHKDFPEIRGSASFPRRAPFEVGVDSGQAGFFDEDAYPHGERADDGYWNKDEFYDKCCDATCGRNNEGEGYGIIDGRGVVSSSGFGDGGYTCDTYLEHGSHGPVVAAEIEFIPDEDESEDDEEDIFNCPGCGTEVDGEDTWCEDCAEAEEEEKS